jgi:hypothetical protein
MTTLNNLKTDTFNSKAYKELTPVMKEAISDIYKIIEKESGYIVTKFDRAIEKVAEFHNINRKTIEEYFDRELEEQLGEK